ncbi:hypothetical protein [Streptomyces daliensis]
MIRTGSEPGPVTLESAGAPRLHEQADELRAAGPAVRVRLPGDVIAWSVTRGDIARRLLTHPHVSKDARKSWPGYVPGAVAWLYSFVDVRSMFTSDGHDHHRLSESALVSTLILMTGVGSEATVALLDHAVRELLAHPG